MPHRLVGSHRRIRFADVVAYKAQKDRAELEHDATLEAIFFFVSRDEAAHAGFYREMLAAELEEDRPGTLTDIAHVIANFKMPGDGLIPILRASRCERATELAPVSTIIRMREPLIVGSTAKCP